MSCRQMSRSGQAPWVCSHRPAGERQGPPCVYWVPPGPCSSGNAVTFKTYGDPVRQVGVECQHTQVFLSDSGENSYPKNCCVLSIQLLTTWNVWMKSKRQKKTVDISLYYTPSYQFHHHSGRCTGRSQHEFVSWASLSPFFVYICDFVTCIIYGGRTISWTQKFQRPICKKDNKK